MIARYLPLAFLACSHPNQTVTKDLAHTVEKPADNAKHTVRAIEVAPAVTLEVLDYGGTGEPMVFLAGLGNTAHIYDDFAPAFTDRFHVVAITRRGFGDSSAAEAGYDVATRAADDLAVLDNLALKQVVLVGHSMAGDELSELAITHPDRVAKLVYLDAIHDHTKVLGLFETLPVQPPDPPAEVMTSWKKLVAWTVREQGIPFPEGEWRGKLDLDPQGAVTGTKGNPKAPGLILGGTKTLDLTQVHTPSLVVLATEQAPQEVFRSADAKQLETLRAWWPHWTSFVDGTVADVKEHLTGAKLVVLPHAHHYVFIDQKPRMLDEMRAFLN